MKMNFLARHWFHLQCYLIMFLPLMRAAPHRFISTVSNFTRSTIQKVICFQSFLFDALNHIAAPKHMCKEVGCPLGEWCLNKTEDWNQWAGNTGFKGPCDKGVQIFGSGSGEDPRKASSSVITSFDTSMRLLRLLFICVRATGFFTKRIWLKLWLCFAKTFA